MIHIEERHKVVVNTDPQRRCYNGCHAKFEIVWSGWKVLDYDVPVEKKDSRLAFWKDLNDYAVSQRGPSALKEFRVVEA